MPTENAPGPAIPLADIAGRWIGDLAPATGSSRIAAIDGATLLGERARLNGFAIPGRRSAGGGCRLLPCLDDGWIALNLARPEDRELIPALFEDARIDPDRSEDVANAVSRWTAAALVERGREMGLAIADIEGAHDGPPIETLVEPAPSDLAQPVAPLVVDMSSLWAGPLAGHLLWLAGAQVIKVEAPQRPDAMRHGDPGLFALLNQGKANVAVDLRTNPGRASLIALLARADIVIEAARPRALKQLGIDAEASLRARPGQVWISITAHGARGADADAVGFGDDCGVAGGLSRALRIACGRIGFVGDAIADPLTGIAAARVAWAALAARRTCRIALSMRGVVRSALGEKQAADPHGLARDLAAWAAAEGQPFPAAAMRDRLAPVHALGADNGRWLGTPPC